MKTEIFYGYKYSSVEDLVKKIHEYIYYYNNFRPYVDIGNITPQIVEDRYYAKDYTTIQKESINLLRADAFYLFKILIRF